MKSYASIHKYKLGGKKVNEDDDIEDDVREMIDMIDKRKFGPSDETDPPGWETDTRYEKEMRVGKVKKGGKAAPGAGEERVILKKNKPFSKKGRRPGYSDWEISEEDERELFINK
ncbi:hypothetical protein KSF78_0005075 [Schistosoma japonicum]|nr:hypothetical protein KSF78_0005075 [Schistosoma japonicum]